MTKNDNDNSKGFTAGFALGLITGAMGTFLVGTERGSEVRSKLSKEWEKAREYLKEQGLMSEEQEKTFAELLSMIKTKVIDEVGLTEELEEKRPGKKRSYTKKSKPTQFKGV
jgi:gas vesicle protein